MMFIELVAIAAIAGQIPRTPSDNALVDGDKVHFFLPPFFVAEGRCLDAKWSADGNYLIAVTENAAVPPSAYSKYFESGKIATAKPEVSVTVASLKTGRAKQVWSVEADPRSRAVVTFFADSDVAIVLIISPSESTTVLRVTGGTSRTEVIETLAGPGRSDADPTGKYVSVVEQGVGIGGNEMTVRFVGKFGDVLIRRPVGGYIFWTRNGDAIQGDFEAGGKFYQVEPGGGGRIVEGRPDFSYPDEPPTQVLTHLSVLPIPGRGEGLRMLLAGVTGQAERILVASDVVPGHEGTTSDNGVFYSTGTVNMVRPIIQLPKSVFDEMVAKQLRAEVMSKLSQVGKAVMMYASDNDGSFPSSDNLEAIRPYIGSAGLLDGFVYHGATAFGADRSQTELGFMPCPGGRAVLYQDGHVVFVPDR